MSVSLTQLKLTLTLPTKTIIKKANPITKINITLKISLTITTTKQLLNLLLENDYICKHMNIQ